MAELETYNPYTLADIERYLQGKMTAAEMHAMEKAALQDPFLSDAIEGYSRAPLNTAHTHLNEITAALTAGKEEAKVVAMPVKKRSLATWGATAAAAVAVVVAIWFITNSSNNESAAKMAAAQTNTPVFTDTLKNEQPLAEASSAGHIGDVAKTDNTKAAKRARAPVAAVESKPRQKEAIKVEMKQEVVTDANAIMPDSLREANLSAVTIQSPGLVANKDVDKNITANNYSVSNNANSGPSYSQNNWANTQVPVLANSRAMKRSAGVNKKPDSTFNNLNGYAAGVNVLVQPNKDMFLPPADKNASKSNGMQMVAANKPIDANVTTFYKADTAKDLLKSLPAVTVTQNGNVAVSPTADAKARKGNGMQIVLTPIPNFDTVAITYLNNKNKSPNMVVDSSLSPQGGWENFRDYVVKRLDKNADTTDLAEGDVELEFTIDDRGLAKDIKITRSLDIAHDAQAADLVKKWPGWVTSRKQKKGKVVIQF